MSEIVVWEPIEIEIALKHDLIAGLRKIADDIEASRMEGKFWKMQGNGMTPRYDQRAHMLVTIDIAAPLQQQLETETSGERTTLASGSVVESERWLDTKGCMVQGKDVPSHEVLLGDEYRRSANATCSDP